MNERILVWDGCQNVRDLGGLCRASQYKVTHHLFWRYSLMWKKAAEIK